MAEQKNAGRDELDDKELEKLLRSSNKSITISVAGFFALSGILLVVVSTNVLFDFSKSTKPLTKEPSRDPAIMASFVNVSNASSGVAALFDVKAAYDQLQKRLDAIEKGGDNAELARILMGERRIPYARGVGNANSVVAVSYGTRINSADKSLRKVANIQIMMPSFKSADYSVQIIGEPVSEVDVGEADPAKPFDIPRIDGLVRFDQIIPTMKTQIASGHARINAMAGELGVVQDRERELIDSYFSRSQVDVFGYYLTMFGRMVVVAVMVSAIGLCIKIIVAELSSLKTLKQIYYASRLAKELPAEAVFVGNVKLLMDMMGDGKYIKHKSVDLQELINKLIERMPSVAAPGEGAHGQRGAVQGSKGANA